MSAINYMQYKDDIYKVRQLSKERFLSSKDTSDGCTIGSINLNGIINQRNSDSLLQFLLSLEFDTIKVIQTIMYIGRDYESDANKIDSNDIQSSDEEKVRYDIELAEPINNPNEVFNEYYESLSDNWKSKETEVEQIYSKVPLYKYLSRAILLLGL